jgi:hypothetical protein
LTEARPSTIDVRSTVFVRHCVAMATWFSRSGWAFAFVVGAVIATVIASASVNGASAAAGSNVCTTTGLTTAVAKRAFGAGGRATSQIYGYSTPICAIAPAGLYVFLYPKSAQSAFQIRSQASGYPSAALAKLPRPSGLGSGPVLFVKQKSEPPGPVWMDFEAGAYVVELQTPEATGPSTQQQWAAIARAIYAHLH